MYVAFTEEHVTCAVTDSPEQAVHFAFILWKMGIVTSVRRMEREV